MSEGAVSEAVDAALESYENADESPLDHGFAHIEGVDGRTKLASKLRECPQVNTRDWDYVTIEGVSRYLTPQRKAYRAFIETLAENGIDTSDLYVRGRLD
ncbi:hypothetical protein HAPG_00074 [Halorubrum phage GNf2]|nr:hypothetical protein HAPG_00074 [Halorubrum phage GNf2]